MAYKILVWGVSSNPGGIENFLFNYITRFDHQKIVFDFINQEEKDLAYEDQIIKMGGKIYSLILPSWRHNMIKRHIEIQDFFKRYAKKYDCIWFNLIDLGNIDVIKGAYRAGISRIIIHAHNSLIMTPGLKGKIRSIKHNWNRKHIYKYGTDFWACSEAAGEWFFNSNNFIVIKNAIDISKYAYQSQKRKELRRRYKISNNTVLIGNVGRLQYQKNQAFAIDVFKSYLKLNPNSKLILVGQGPDYRKLKEKVERLEIKDKVIFTGVQNDIDGYLSMMDIFLFPSHFEGLGIAGLEAQANGLPVLATKDKIPSDLKLNSNFEFVSLNSSPEVWGEKIASLRLNYPQRLGQNEIKKNFNNAGYTINSTYKLLENMLMDH